MTSCLGTKGIRPPGAHGDDRHPAVESSLSLASVSPQPSLLASSSLKPASLSGPALCSDRRAAGRPAGACALRAGGHGGHARGAGQVPGCHAAQLRRRRQRADPWPARERCALRPTARRLLPPPHPRRTRTTARTTLWRTRRPQRRRRTRCATRLCWTVDVRTQCRRVFATLRRSFAAIGIIFTVATPFVPRAAEGAPHQRARRLLSRSRRGCALASDRAPAVLRQTQRTARSTARLAAARAAVVSVRAPRSSHDIQSGSLRLAGEKHQRRRLSRAAAARQAVLKRVHAQKLRALRGQE